MLEFNNDFIRVFMLWNFSSGIRIPASIADKVMGVNILGDFHNFKMGCCTCRLSTKICTPLLTTKVWVYSLDQGKKIDIALNIS